MTAPRDERQPDEVERRVADLMADYAAEQHDEDGDPEAYLDRMWTLLEGMRESPDPDPVGIEAITAFLNRVERVNERPT